MAEAIRKQYGVEIDRRKIEMADIKAFGEYTATLKFGSGVVAEVTVSVAE